MLKRLICYLWGHKVIVKAYTGDVVHQTDRLTLNVVEVPMYRWEKQKFCLRCEKDNTQ